MFDRWRKAGKKEAEARRAELEGDLARATALWDEAGRPNEAARVMVLRGDAEVDPLRRRQFYLQASALAPASPVGADARRKRAELAIATAQEGVASAIARHDLLEAGAELEALGEHARAAEAYALAGDLDAQARALVEAGDVDQLEDVLDRDRARVTAERTKRSEEDDVTRLVAMGERREALVRARAGASTAASARSLEARRALVSGTPVEIDGKPVWLALGTEVLVGRSADECAIAIASAAVSRRHLAFARDTVGRATLRDLGSRNGTDLRGMRVGGTMEIPDAGLEVKLGGEIVLRVGPSEHVARAIAIEVAGRRWIAPLGEARLASAPWRLEAGKDRWLELVTDGAPAFAPDGTTRGPRIALLHGDAFAATRGGAIVLRVPQA